LKNLRVYSVTKILKKNKIHDLVKSLSSELDFALSNLEINIVAGKEIHAINKTYLQHNYTTDIIAFNYSDLVKQIDGELFISIDDAIDNAKKFKVSLSDELVRLVIHGVLHLLGFDDQTTSDKKTMKRLENKLLYKNKFILF
jgi:rRNA maturation RNase YbeY